MIIKRYKAKGCVGDLNIMNKKTTMFDIEIMADEDGFTTIAIHEETSDFLYVMPINKVLEDLR